VGAEVGDNDDEQAITRGARKLARMTIAEDVRKVYLVARSVLRGARDRDADQSAQIPNAGLLIRRIERRLKRVLRDWDRRKGLKRPQSHTGAIAAAMFHGGSRRFKDLLPDGQIALELVSRKYGHPPDVIDRYAKEGRRFRKRPIAFYCDVDPRARESPLHGARRPDHLSPSVVSGPRRNCSAKLW